MNNVAWNVLKHKTKYCFETQNNLLEFEQQIYV